MARKNIFLNLIVLHKFEVSDGDLTGKIKHVVNEKYEFKDRDESILALFGNNRTINILNHRAK